MLSDEFKNLFSLDGYSSIVRSSNPFVKLVWLVMSIVLVTFGLVSVTGNINEFWKRDVVTNIQTVDDEFPVIFPAISLCPFPPTKLKDFLLHSTFDNKAISIDSKEYTIYTYKGNQTCYIINSIRSQILNKSESLTTNKEDSQNGLRFLLYIKSDIQFLGYSANYPNELPEQREILNPITIGASNSINLNKKVHLKLGEPYSRCRDDLNMEDSFDSDLYRDTVKTGYSYRRVNCYNLCYFKHVSLQDTGIKEFEKRKCDEFCPLECRITKYDVDNDVFYHRGLYKEMFYKNISSKYNLSNLTLDEFTESYTDVIFYFKKLEYVQILESARISESSLMSNVGGTLGIFLEVSFLSAYRSIDYLMRYFFN